MNYFIHIAIIVSIYIVLAISLNLLLGYTGLMSIAHGAFWGLGSYAAALLLLNMGVNFFVALIGAVGITMIIAALLAGVALRARSDYLVLLTLAFQMITFGLLVNLRGLTKGYQGLINIPRPEILGSTLTSPTSYLPLVVGIAALSFFIVWWITHSPFGRVLKAMREDEDVALSLGKDVVRFKVISFMVAGGIAAVAGTLFATYATWISPEFFKYDVSILMLAIVALGGMANLWGTLVGAIIFVGMPQMLIFAVSEIKIFGILVTSTELFDPIRAVVFGVVLIVFMRFRPQGIIPEYKSFRLGKAKPYAPLPPEEADKILWQAGVDQTPLKAQSSREAVIEVKGLVKNFGGIRATDELTLTLPGNRISALIGPNGAGKTTAYNLITRFLRADAGRVYYRGRDITKCSPHQITHLGVARSFQGARVMDGMKVLDNVLAARPRQSGENLWLLFFCPWRVVREEKENRRYAMACLSFVGLAELAQSLAVELSFGQKKRLQIACLLATEAEILLLDEPVSGVDPARIGDIMELMRKLISRGKTICIIEHNLDVVKDVAVFSYFLDQGRVVAKGTPSTLMADRRLAELYFGT